MVKERSWKIRIGVPPSTGLSSGPSNSAGYGTKEIAGTLLQKPKNVGKDLEQVDNLLDGIDYEKYSVEAIPQDAS